ncbi:MAG TPA: hypothetical protein VLF66_02460 [Thermoanaerobaculia bacterium]|nr:hypothetical protein [Thermoanaerobaculia bacterium]
MDIKTIPRTFDRGARVAALLPTLATVLAVAVAWVVPPPAEAAPHFARRYEVSCSRCHVLPPKLNEFGERFLAAGYDSPELTAKSTWPVALWATGRAESVRLAGGEREEIGPYVNRVELISGGKLLRPWLSYFLEWRLVSQETRADGTLRDRSGRLEDALLIFGPGENFELVVGQFRQVNQIDVSRRLSLSEPLVLSASLPGEGGSTPRRTSLRGFSPAGRSPSVRAAWNDRAKTGWDWTASVAVPMPGELSIPLSSEAEREASNEFEAEPKGVVLEGFVRRGLTSFGGHAFYDDGDRYLVNGVVTGRFRPLTLFWTAMAGFDEVEGTRRGRWSLEGEYVPSDRWGLGARIENRSNDGAAPAFLPFVVWHHPLHRTARLTVAFEQRLQEERNASILEVGLLF